MKSSKWLGLAAALNIAGCTALDGERFDEASALARRHVGTAPILRASAEDRDAARAEVAKVLAKPLSAEEASRVAVAFSPSFQAILAEQTGQSAQATQSARLPNPVFTFERLLRGEAGGVDKEINRMLAIPVVDLLLLPARMRAADYRHQQLRIGLSRSVLQAAAVARKAWVRAVAAQQSARYAAQVKDSADASAELALRMQQAGNFSKLQRAREQAFNADAVAQLARARHAATAAREELVRALGLDAGEAIRLTLPERLPDLPPRADDESAIARLALDERLDVRMARADLEYLARQQGMARVTSYVDGLTIAGEHNSETGRERQRGYQLEMPLPIFDFGGARRTQARAEYMAALNRAAAIGASATSQVRESYSAYCTAHELARHYRDEIVPLRKAIAEEMLLRYNGMLTGVFDLLADSRDQIASVIQAIDAERDFWLADSDLRLALAGSTSKESP
ncbi:MAG: TolC family protein [Usitatibacter sp.]